MKCKHGKLKSPVRESGKMRYCKIKRKTKLGRKLDRMHKSKEFHEKRYRGER